MNRHPLTTFHQYCLLREMAANRSLAHLLDVAHSDRLMVVISAFREGRDQPPPRSMRDLERDIRSQQGYEVVHNPACDSNPDAQPEVEGPNVVASLPKTGHLGVTKSRGGFKERQKDAEGRDVLDDQGQPVEYDVCEDSLVVSHRRGPGHPSDEEVLQFFTALCRKYRQEAFLFKSPASDEVFMVSQTGDMNSLGAFTGVGKLAPYFTMLRQGPNYNDRRVSALPKPTQADSLGGPSHRRA